MLHFSLTIFFWPLSSSPEFSFLPLILIVQEYALAVKLMVHGVFQIHKNNTEISQIQGFPKDLQKYNENTHEINLSSFQIFHKLLHHCY